MDTSYQVGVAKHEVTCCVPGVGMMGYGQPHNTVQEVATPLWARALFLEDERGKIVLIIHLELAFVTMALKEEILYRLQSAHPEWKLEDADLLLTAQHTHSAPGGFSHYPLYNLTITNFQTKVFETIVTGSVAAAEAAYQNRKSAEVTWGQVEISPDREVAFNRSMHAYLNNEDAPKLKQEERALGVDRMMQGLLVKDSEGKLISHLNWFAVHCTSVSSFNNRIHHDNKGVAAELFERNHPGCVAFFFQSNAGDVSPNFVWDKKLSRMRGKFSDQYDNAAYNGEIQFRESEKIQSTLSVSGKVETYHSYVDMSKKAAPPAHGLAFFRGTLEGPGVPSHVAAVLRVTSRIRRIIDCVRSPDCRDFYLKHGVKDIVIDHRNGNFVGVPLKFWKSIPTIPSHPLNLLQDVAKKKAIETLPWVPSIIPFQLLRLGNIVIAALPGEITTMAGQRVRQLIEKEVVGCGVDKVIIHSYANAYMGYITTAEEYDKQAYEGGHNVYGRSSLDAVLETYRQLVTWMRGDYCALEKVSPFRFPKEELDRRSV